MTCARSGTKIQIELEPNLKRVIITMMILIKSKLSYLAVNIRFLLKVCTNYLSTNYIWLRNDKLALATIAAAISLWIY